MGKVTFEQATLHLSAEFADDAIPFVVWQQIAPVIVAVDDFV